MLGENKLKILLDLVQTSSKDELLWMNGYMNGIVEGLAGKAEPVPHVPAAPKKITILYGTETGNSKRLATDFAVRAKARNIMAKVVGMDQYRLADLPKEDVLLAVVSTHGEGEPPIAAKKFYDHIHNNGFKLPGLRFGVLALGDTSYPLFCKTGEDVDMQLDLLGGKRIAQLQKCDLEYEEEANRWFTDVLQNLIEPAAEAIIAPLVAVVSVKKTGKQIYEGRVISHINLNDRGSNKQTYHIEIAADNLEYECGDSVGIVAENPVTEVEAILQIVGADAGRKITFKNEEMSLYELLRSKINIYHLTERLVKMYASIAEQDVPAVRFNLLDLLKIYPVKDAAEFEEVVGKMNAISPRLYTIASSPGAHDGEVHILVVKDQYHVNNELQFGLCSNYLGLLEVDTTQRFFIQPNKRFRLPAADNDIIMIGPGTGIAPFRSFLAEREATGATGKNWLFFGEQHFVSDFLYQTEIQNWYETGVLSKVNLAFSRDQVEKIYVQHKMLEHAAEFFAWVEAGAHIYLCGQKAPMGIDVERTLLRIIQEQGNYTEANAKEYLDQLEASGRYEKDVY